MKKYTLMLRCFINKSAPAVFTAEEGEKTEAIYAGQGMWIEPNGVFNSIEECLKEAENKFKEAGCNYIRNGNEVIESK